MRWPVVVALVLAACGDKEPNAEQRIPKLAPPPVAPIPADLRIDVVVDGVAGPVIDARRLEATAPDFADEQRRAWRLDRFVPGAVSYEVTGARDVTITLKEAPPAVPILMLSRRGDVVVTLADPKEPFPEFHGEGGRLGRPGDPYPRIMKVTRIVAKTVP